MSAQVKLWPTPTVPRPHDNENTAGKYIPSQNQFDLAAAVTLSDKIAVEMALAKEVKLYATPCAGDAVGSHGGGNNASLRTDVGGQLNPDWVDWMMGFLIGWTDIDVDMTIEDAVYNPHYFDEEPPGVPRVASGIKNRVDRLQSDGNAVVPYQFYPIAQAIATMMQETNAK